MEIQVILVFFFVSEDQKMHQIPKMPFSFDEGQKKGGKSNTNTRFEYWFHDIFPGQPLNKKKHNRAQVSGSCSQVSGSYLYYHHNKYPVFSHVRSFGHLAFPSKIRQLLTLKCHSIYFLFENAMGVGGFHYSYTYRKYQPQQMPCKMFIHFYRQFINAFQKYVTNHGYSHERKNHSL